MAGNPDTRRFLAACLVLGVGACGYGGDVSLGELLPPDSANGGTLEFGGAAADGGTFAAGGTRKGRVSSGGTTSGEIGGATARGGRFGAGGSVATIGSDGGRLEMPVINGDGGLAGSAGAAPSAEGGDQGACPNKQFRDSFLFDQSNVDDRAAISNSRTPASGVWKANWVLSPLDSTASGVQGNSIDDGSNLVNRSSLGLDPQRGNDIVGSMSVAVGFSGVYPREYLGVMYVYETRGESDSLVDMTNRRLEAKVILLRSAPADCVFSAAGFSRSNTPADDYAEAVGQPVALKKDVWVDVTFDMNQNADPQRVEAAGVRLIADCPGTASPALDQAEFDIDTVGFDCIGG